MNDLVAVISSWNWFDPNNKLEGIKLAKGIELELDNMHRKVLNTDAYFYHKKCLSVLGGKLTKLWNKDTSQWWQVTVIEARDVKVS